MVLSRIQVAVALLLSACVDEGAGWTGKKVDPAVVQDNLIAPDKLPELVRMDVELGHAVVYLGNTATNVITPTTPTKLPVDGLPPGGTVEITHFWKVITPPGPNWRVFAFLKGDPNTADFMYLPPTDMQQAHPPSTWRAGELIRDSFIVSLRPDWKSPQATLYVGLIADGKHGSLDRMEATGNANAATVGSSSKGGGVVDRAIVARTLAVDLSRSPPPAGTIYVQRAQGPVTIDGVANDPGWLGVPSSPDFVLADGAKTDPPGKATAKMTWDDDNLYLFVQIADTDIFSEYKKHDDKVYLEDCVEIFIDADGNKRGYVELQVNPNNATFDSWFPNGRAPHGDEAWDSNMTTAVKVHGTADISGDGDTGWEVELAIPWAAVKGRDSDMKVRLPPQVGDKWKLNVVRVDGKYPDKGYVATSWNRISMSDFHGLDRMLTAVFADTTGSIAVKKPPMDAPAPAQGSGSSAMEGSGSASGSASQGSASQGSASQGSASQGSASQGSAAKASAPQGSAAQGSGSVPTRATNGSVAPTPKPTSP